MNTFLDKILGNEVKTQEPDYFHRNSGKKILATVLTPTEAEIKQKESEE